MKVYFIDKIQNEQVFITATSIEDLENKAIAYSYVNFGGCTKIYVHCSTVFSLYGKQHDIKYIIRIDNQRRTITTRRI